MHGDSVAVQIAKWVGLGALFLIPFAPLIVADGYFFPFITGKAFYLRILIEITVGAWVVLAFADKEYRPRFSWIGASVLAFVLWMFIADVLAVNSLKAFWSNFERMEGWMLLVHLLGFFVAAGALLRVEKKWHAWFLTSLVAAAIISGYALLQLSGSLTIHQGSTRIDATLGNSAYLAVYLLFSMFVALWLAFSDKYRSLKWIFVGFAVLEGILIFYTETRGTIVGLMLALALAAGLTALTAGKRARYFGFGALAALVLFVGSIYLARDSAFVNNSHVLQRVASISVNTLQTRFAIWNMAWGGVMERPLIGWGQEGFNYVFNKYYDPSLFYQEQWFDRAHNAFIDWLSAGGFPAFILYICLFGSALILLWRNSQLSRAERIFFTAALVGYAVHNMSVFDNLYSYIYFFALLAFIDSQTSRPIVWMEKMPVVTATSGITYVLPIAAVTTIGIIWLVNASGMSVASKLIVAMSPTDDVSKNLAAFEDLAAHPNFAAQEVREQIITFASAVVQSGATTQEQKQRAVTLAITEMQKQIASYPDDAREHYQLSFAYRTAGDLADALAEMNAALALSPKKEEFLIEKGTLEWAMGDLKAAQASFSQAYALGPQFETLALYAAAGDIAAGDQAAGDKILQERYGTTAVDSDILSTAYYHAGNWPRLIGLWQSRAENPDAPVETLFGLAAAYYAAGDKNNAVKVINAAVAKYPSAAAVGAAAIKQITGK